MHSACDLLSLQVRRSSALAIAGWLLLSCAAVTAAPSDKPQLIAKGGGHKAVRKKNSPTPVDQIYETPGGQVGFSSILNVEGTPGYCYTASGATRGIYCRKVHYGGLANQFGLNPGDMLISFNGHALSSIAEADRYLQSAQPRQIQAVFAHPEADRLALYSVVIPFGGFKANSRVDTNVRTQYNQQSQPYKQDTTPRVRTY